MQVHKFGIMDAPPKSGVQYNDFEPWKYGCISVDEEYIEAVSGKLACIDCFHHSLDRPAKDLAYYGITLIPPSSVSRFIDCLNGEAGGENLINLMKKAEAENKFVIHFGI